MKKLLLGCAVAALAAPAAYAQSTGSIDFENQEIVVTGVAGPKAVAGVNTPDTPKAKVVLTQEIIAHQVPGQSVNDIINLVPGVSFQNNDPFGSAGGKMSIRGFDNTRISQTFDGLPLNDTGGYALYSNQQIDPELIDQVNVNLGTTDVDSPTAAASGSTVNLRSRNPSQDFGVKVVSSVGEYDFFRVFGLVDTGEFTSFGTRAWFSASSATNNAIYGGYGKVDKQQYNFKIYQPVGDNGDFVSLAGHWNQNRNNFFGSVPLRTDVAGGRVVGSASSNRFPITKDERFYEVARCTVTPATPGVKDTANSCGSLYEYRFNPSDTGNIRLSSRFTLSDGLVLTVDPSYQYTKANGGGTVEAIESAFKIGDQFFPGYFGGKPYVGADLNGDGDTLDTVRMLAPSQTKTDRLGLIASLRYDIDDHNTVRLAYSYDRGRHRQTGEVGFLDAYGNAIDVFPVDNPVLGSDGNRLQKRDRLSYAILHQVSGEYRGEFFDERLTVNAGLRAPFFKRNLNQYCFTSSNSGFVDCMRGNDAAEDAYAAANPNFARPQKRVFNYDKLLPTAGVVFNVMPKFSVFGNYSKGVQVPGTDNLYQSFWYAPGTDAADPSPETTDNFDLGVRYTSGKIQAQLSGWYTNYKNRLASSYDFEQNVTIYRNLGKVEKYGVDGSISYQPIPEASFYVFGSYLKSKIKDDVVIGRNGAGDPIYGQTAGKRESGAPTFTFGGRAQGTLGPVQLGVQAKRTGPRYVNDQNLPVFQSGVQVYGAKAPAYTLVDLDARLSLEWAGLNDKTYFQLNVTNLFDKLYVGGFDGTTSNTTVTTAQIGAPRTVIGSIIIGF
ncbi:MULTISPECIES: TonB-dependent receptor [Sphingomonas]|uniref:TonB-dependent receptor n=1 Tax=Edaphosphingomonas fennica TaxID=114404 RepID=A0A2T4HN10_9SPHN|nr:MULTISPECIES: TonB-dependent receptor [Sphingomonas]MDX3882965.1 TonB-dependent receptor [Sphingomonas sp.]PTD17202.1 TonB-dependent receptor [Sphingomonas fennica]